MFQSVVTWLASGKDFLLGVAAVIVGLAAANGLFVLPSPLSAGEVVIIGCALLGINLASPTSGKVAARIVTPAK